MYYILLPVTVYFTGKPLTLGVFESLRGNLPLLIVSLLAGIVMGGIVEEFIFRGFFLKKLSETIPGHAGILFSVVIVSVFFGSLHAYQGITGQIITGIAGGYLCLIYFYFKKNLWRNMLTHGLINIMSMLLVYFGLAGT